MRSNITLGVRSNPVLNWMMSDFDDLLDRTSRQSDSPRLQNLIPFDVTESDSGYLMTVDLPGVRKEDIKLEVVDNTLTVSGERKRYAEAEGHKFFCRFAIPEHVNSEKFEARMESGVLEIGMPKAEARA